jgi:geranylgeranyl pyrophosphate synthase
MTHAASHDEKVAPVLAALDRLLARIAPTTPRGGDAATRCASENMPFELWKRALFGPVQEFLRRPGKEFRGKLTQLAWRGAGGRGEMPHALPWVAELLHAGSLIVDDVQDDSSHRRGGPALHRLIGAPLAINTGTWMYFWALSLIEELPLPELARGELTRECITAMMKCHQGQALDLSIHIGQLEPRQIPAAVAATTRNKTGVLMGLAARIGALAAGASAERCAAIAHFGEELGVGLQMLDDLGAITSRSRRDKGLEDLRGGRPTWPWAWLCSTVDELAVARLQQRLRAATAPSAGDDEAEAVMLALRDAALPVGRPAVRGHLQRCLHDVAAHLSTEAHTALVREIERLEASYG